MLIILSSLVLLVFVNSAPPPQRPPADILDDLTLGGTIPVSYYYVDDSNNGTGTHYKYSRDDITNMIGQAQLFIERTIKSPIPEAPEFSYDEHSLPTILQRVSEVWLVHGLSGQNVTGARALVFGSTSPWIECLLLALGAAHVTTVEYNRLTYDHPSLSTCLVGQLYPDQLFDIALSISSFDHDGLGRYGDPINPTADLEAMQYTKTFLKPQGLLFLTVPVGRDAVVWNLHRVYGESRLPLLLEGWLEVGRVGWSHAHLNTTHSNYEPLFILTHSITDLFD